MTWLRHSQLRMSAKIYNKNAINSFKSWFLMGCVNVLVKSIVTELSASMNRGVDSILNPGGLAVM